MRMVGRTSAAKMVRGLAGLVCRLVGFLAILVGVAAFDLVWTPAGVLVGGGLVVAASALAPGGRTRPARTSSQTSRLLARDGKPFGPLVNDPALPRHPATWFDDM